MAQSAGGQATDVWTPNTDQGKCIVVPKRDTAIGLQGLKHLALHMATTPCPQKAPPDPIRVCPSHPGLLTQQSKATAHRMMRPAAATHVTCYVPLPFCGASKRHHHAFWRQQTAPAHKEMLEALPAVAAAAALLQPSWPLHQARLQKPTACVRPSCCSEELAPQSTGNQRHTAQL
jgi:hypothetical protein